jgi:3-methyl-2-oxobutanoate hydroxymethyltransferase
VPKIFDKAGIDFLLVGDSAGNTVFGFDTTLPVTVGRTDPAHPGRRRSRHRAFVVADLPFGSYESSPEEALHTAFRFMKETGAHAVKLEGGVRSAEQIRRIVSAGIPVMAHIGFTPQSEHGLGGHIIQGRGEGLEQLLADAHAVEDAGAFSVVLEMVPSEAAAQVTKELRIPTIGVGAGPDVDGQLWSGPTGPDERWSHPQVRSAVRESHSVLTDAVTAFRSDVESGTYPAPEHSYE